MRAATGRRTHALLGALLLGAVTACGGGAAPRSAGPTTQSASSSSATTTTPPTTTPPTTTTSGPGGRMTQGLSSPVLLERTGGIAGRRETLELRPDGTVTVSTRGSRPVTRQLSEGQLAQVVAAVKAANLRAAQATPRRTAASADMFSYKLVAEGTAVRTTDEQADGAVRRLLDVLLQLFSAPVPTP